MATTKKKTTARAAGPAQTEGETAHDDFYRGLRARITAWADEQGLKSSYRDYLLLVPDMFHFLTMLMMEPSAKVPTKYKAWLGVAVGYVLSPVDFLPDAFFPLGLLDDLVVMVVVLDSILDGIPANLVKKHWAGSSDLFTVVRESLEKADDWVGKGLFRRIRNYLAKQGLWKSDEDEAVPPPVPQPGAAPASRTAKKRTPSKRPAAKKTAAKKTAAKKKTTRKVTKKTTKKAGKKTTAKKASTRTVSAKKKTSSKKKTTKKRTIGPKKGGSSS